MVRWVCGYPFGAMEPTAVSSEAQNGERPTKPIQIDFDDIHLRVITVPLPAGIYGQVAGLSKKRVIATQFPIEGTLGKSWLEEQEEGKGTLLMYDFLNAKAETLVSKVSDFTLSQDGKTLAYRSGKRLRVLPAGQKPDEKHEQAPPSRESGWIDLRRVRCAVVPTNLHNCTESEHLHPQPPSPYCPLSPPLMFIVYYIPHAERLTLQNGCHTERSEASRLGRRLAL